MRKHPPLGTDPELKKLFDRSDEVLGTFAKMVTDPNRCDLHRLAELNTEAQRLAEEMMAATRLNDQGQFSLPADDICT